MFVGLDMCGECYMVVYDIWENGVDGNGGFYYYVIVLFIDFGERIWV